MIVFQCPSCQAKLQVADEHAGATIQCPTCQAMATAPRPSEAVAAAPAAVPPQLESAPTAVTTPEHAKMADRKPGRDDADDDGPRRRRRDEADPAKPVSAGMGTGLIVFLVLGVVGCVGLGVVAILVALLVPAVQKVREAAARTQSTNNLKQIALCMHSFHDVNKRLPFNGSDEAPKNAFGVGVPMIYKKTAKPNDPLSGSWGFQILPYIDQQPMYAAVDRGFPVMAYMNPGRGRPMTEAGKGAWTDYFYNNYLNNTPDNDNADVPDRPDAKRTMVGITDGTSNTVSFGEGNVNTAQYLQTGNVVLSTNVFDGGTLGTMRAGNPGQVSPGGVTLRRDSAVNPTVGSWGGPWPQGGLVAMCDGTVRMFPYSSPNLNVFLTPTGGEAAALPD